MQDTARPEIDTTVTCACGGVTLTAKGRVRSMLLCGCGDCRMVTGTGHSAVAIFSANDVTVNGETTAYERPAESGATVTRHFCPRCGTTIHAKTTRAPGTMLIPAGLLGGDGWFRPGQMIFGHHPLDWDTLPPDIPRHAAYRDTP